MGKVYTGNIGALVILDCKSDLSGATNVKIAVLKPDGSEVEWTAAVYNTYYVKYTIQAADFNVAGEYKLQATFTLSGWTGRGETAIYKVYEHYK